MPIPLAKTSMPRFAQIQTEQLQSNGDCQASRNFCYVANVVQAKLLAATVKNLNAFNHIYNFA
jgi:UDP-N-acetylglucosamine 4-epimerase